MNIMETAIAHLDRDSFLSPVELHRRFNHSSAFRIYFGNCKNRLVIKSAAAETNRQSFNSNDSMLNHSALYHLLTVAFFVLLFQKQTTLFTSTRHRGSHIYNSRRLKMNRQNIIWILVNFNLRWVVVHWGAIWCRWGIERVERLLLDIVDRSPLKGIVST